MSLGISALSGSSFPGGAGGTRMRSRKMHFFFLISLPHRNLEGQKRGFGCQLILYRMKQISTKAALENKSSVPSWRMQPSTSLSLPPEGFLPLASCKATRYSIGQTLQDPGTATSS